MIMEKDKILKRWEEYIRELFDDDRGDKPRSYKQSGLQIMESEVAYGLKCMSRGKAAGPDGLMVEMFEALGDFGIKRITQLANKIYDEGRFPPEMTKSVFIALPKKPGATKCELFRTISLMSQLTKLILRVLLNRIRGRTAGEVSEEQYGFMPDKGTRNAIFLLRMLSERSIEMQKDLYVCFVDYVKAFDKIQHRTLIEMLEILDVDGKEIDLIASLYWNQVAAINIDGSLSDWITIQRGARQGCNMSPDLFALYAEKIMKAAKELDGIRVGGVNINNLRYADDTTLIADSETKLQNLLNSVVTESELKGLTLNRKKSVCMVFSKSTVQPSCNITVNGEKINQVEQFSYLGSLVTHDGRCDKEIRRRIGIAKSVFRSMEKVLTTRSISMPTKLRL